MLYNNSLLMHTYRVLLPSGDLDLDVKNCHVSADLGFHYSPKQLSWVPYFQRLDVSFGAIDVNAFIAFTLVNQFLLIYTNA